jgi:hypothetical protein
VTPEELAQEEAEDERRRQRLLGRRFEAGWRDPHGEDYRRRQEAIVAAMEEP